MSQDQPAAGADADSLVPALEAVLFAAPEALTLRTLASVFPGTAPEVIEEALTRLQTQLAVPGRGIRLVTVAGGWQLRTREDYFSFVQGIARVEREEQISPAAIETLSVVAYKQPVTRAEVDAIRGAASGPHLRLLMERGMIRVSGRADVPGAPFQYGTTKQFLKHFGLQSVKDLPDPKELAKLMAEQGRQRDGEQP